MGFDFSNLIKEALAKGQPQQNQYLTGNPSTDPGAQTNWMSPGNQSTPSGNDMGVPQGTGPQQSDGTAVGTVAAGGTVGQYMPEGYNQDKWNDANKHDPKYDIGRILSKYPPGPEGLRQAAQELQASGLAHVTGDDKIILDQGSGQYAGRTIDVGRAFSDPNASHAWQWGDNTQDTTAAPLPGTRFMGGSQIQQQQKPMGQAVSNGSLFQGLQPQTKPPMMSPNMNLGMGMHQQMGSPHPGFLGGNQGSTGFLGGNQRPGTTFLGGNQGSNSTGTTGPIGGFLGGNQRRQQY